MVQILLKELNGTDNRIKGSELVSKDGMVLDYLVQDAFNEDHVSAVSAALFNVSKHINSQIIGGDGLFEHVVVKGELGKVLVTPLNQEAFLITLTQANVDAKLTLQQMSVFKEKYLNPALVLEPATA